MDKQIIVKFKNKQGYYGESNESSINTNDHENLFENSSSPVYLLQSTTYLPADKSIKIENSLLYDMNFVEHAGPSNDIENVDFDSNSDMDEMGVVNTYPEKDEDEVYLNLMYILLYTHVVKILLFLQHHK